MHVSDDGFRAGAYGERGVQALGALAEKRLVEREKTKRLLIAAVVVLFIVGVVVMLFAPPGKEQLAYVIGSVLILLSVGAIGASRVILRVPGIELSAQSTVTPLAGSDDRTFNERYVLSRRRQRPNTGSPGPAKDEATRTTADGRDVLGEDDLYDDDLCEDEAAVAGAKPVGLRVAGKSGRRGGRWTSSGTG